MRYNLWQFFSYEKKRKIKNKDWKIPWITKKKAKFFLKKRKRKRNEKTKQEKSRFPKSF